MPLAMKTAAFSLIVLTLNAAGPRRVHQGWPTRREAIVSRLKAEASDAAAFQEVWRPEDLEALAEGAGHRFRAHDAALGVAVTSRRPILSSRALDLGDGYGALRARVLDNGREADLIRRDSRRARPHARRLGQLCWRSSSALSRRGPRPRRPGGRSDDRGRASSSTCWRRATSACPRRRVAGARWASARGLPPDPHSRPPRGRLLRLHGSPPRKRSPPLSHFGLRARLDSAFPRLKLRTQPEGRAEALVETETILERARADAARRESSAGWLPWLGAQRTVAARDETARLSALIEEVRSAVIRAQRATASLAPS